MSRDKAERKPHWGAEIDIGVVLEQSDADQHIRAALGQTNLEYPRTGSTEKRPVSSLMLFSKDGKVFWKLL